MNRRFKYRLTIEADQIVTPFSESGIFRSIGNKPAKLHIGHDGRIEGWDRDSAINAERQIGAGDCIVGPGFIDLHFHGYGEQADTRYSEIGIFANPAGILETITGHGTVACLATLLVPVKSRRFFGIDLDARFRMLRAQLAGLVMRDHVGGSPRARLAGIHIEGPKLNPEAAGAIPSSSLWDASAHDIPMIIGEDELADGHGVRVMTMAPEMDIASDFSFLRALIERGIIVALGHSSASLEQTIAAVKAGASHLTHIFNAMTPLSHRNPGIIGAGLIDPRLYDSRDNLLSIEIICDFIHVSPAALSLAIDRHRLVAGVTDAVAHPGMAEGTYEFAGQRVSVFDGAVRTLEDGRLAGSMMTMLRTFRNLLLLGGDEPDLVRAFEITSTGPAGIIGLDDSGKIEKGRRADLVVLDRNWNLLYTIVNGEIAYESPSLSPGERRYPLAAAARASVPKPVAGEAIIGLRISAQSLWCGYVAENERVTITLDGENPNPRFKQGFTGREAILDSAAGAIASAWKQAREKGVRVTGLGIATSGLVFGTRAVMGMNLPAWNDFDIAAELLQRSREHESSIPPDLPVAVENSANAMAMAIARTRRLRESIDLRKGENFVFVKIGWGLGTGVVVNERPISSIEDIPPDFYSHLRKAIGNIHDGLPTLLHQTVLINRLVAKGELALMRTCDDEFPEYHLESLVSMTGMIHYARAEEKRAGKIFFRREKIRNLLAAIEKSPYSYESTCIDLELTVSDIIDALNGSGEESEHGAAVFERMGMALGSGIFSLSNTIPAPIKRVVVLPQLVGEFNPGIEVMRHALISSLSRGAGEAQGWKVNFISADRDLFVHGGAALCYM
jgi:N-acetylglucosamine-6-phosphate deacetylase